MIGSHASRTRGSAAAFAAISSPMPAGSPAVIATRGSAMAAAACAPAAAAAAARRVVARALAAAAAVLDAFGVRQLVAQAALEPSAQTRQLRRVQAQVLLLRHLDRHRLERVQEGRAAQRAAAGAVPADHLRFVADADLAHLDARAEFARELAHQLAEVDARVGGEVEDQLRAVEGVLDARQLHREAALADLHVRDPKRLAFAPLVPLARDDVLARREAHDLRHLLRRLPL